MAGSGDAIREATVRSGDSSFVSFAAPNRGPLPENPIATMQPNLTVVRDGAWNKSDPADAVRFAGPGQ